ncbi:uncharacterized protein LY79DRAFT_572586, partial [Colletotrichum navitas]
MLGSAITVGFWQVICLLTLKFVPCLCIILAAGRRQSSPRFSGRACWGPVVPLWCSPGDALWSPISIEATESLKTLLMYLI